MTIDERLDELATLQDGWLDRPEADSTEGPALRAQQAETEPHSAGRF